MDLDCLPLMPFKHNADRRRHIPKRRFKVRNWTAYEVGLRRRGSLTLWVTEDVLATWQAVPRTTPGGQAQSLALAIETALMVRLVFHQPLRQTEGLLASLLELLELDLPVPWADADRRHVYHVYGVRVPARDAVQTQLAAAGIATNIHYPVPVHLQPAYADLGYRRGDFPESERFGAEALSLPMFPELTEVQIERVCAALNEAGHVCAA